MFIYNKYDLAPTFYFAKSFFFSYFRYFISSAVLLKVAVVTGIVIIHHPTIEKTEIRNLHHITTIRKDPEMIAVTVVIIEVQKNQSLFKKRI